MLEISKELSNTARSWIKLLDKVVDFTFQIMNVDRVSILLLEPTTSELVPRISKTRTGGSGASKHVPQSIARKAVEERVAILSDNAAADERFKGKSILIQSVRSAMCTPLMGTDQTVLGILYVDNLTATHSFADEDLEFLIAFGSLAAVGIENSQRSEQLRRRSARAVQLPALLRAERRRGDRAALRTPPSSSGAKSARSSSSFPTFAGSHRCPRRWARTPSPRC